MSSKNSVALRFATGMGLSLQKREGYMIVNDFVKEVIKNKQLIVYDKDFKRSFVHLTDMIRAYLFAIKNFEIMKGGIFNVGTEKNNYSKGEIALKIQKQYPYELFFKDGSKEDQRDYFVSFEKIKKLGFEAEVSVDDAIQELIKGYSI